MAEQPITERRIDRGLFDAYAPDEIARRIEIVGVKKAGQETLPVLTLSVLAGAFIAFGAMFYSVVITGSDLGLGPSRLLGGVAFSLGLILVLVGGAELFTGNVLIVMGWAHGKVALRALLRNWGLVFVGNFAGAVGMAGLAYWSGFLHIGGDAVAVTAIRVAAAKVALPVDIAFVRGVLCNALVCLAVWLCFAAHAVVDKVLAIVFPIAAFVALGFEHSIANMYFIPVAILAAGDPALLQAAGVTANGLDGVGFVRNLVPVTLGNIVGGGAFVALTYYVVYLRGRD
jgi:formate/nitrite transporter